jgi:hypothetical protein
MASNNYPRDYDLDYVYTKRTHSQLFLYATFITYGRRALMTLRVETYHDPSDMDWCSGTRLM